MTVEELIRRLLDFDLKAEVRDGDLDPIVGLRAELGLVIIDSEIIAENLVTHTADLKVPK